MGTAPLFKCLCHSRESGNLFGKRVSHKGHKVHKVKGKREFLAKESPRQAQYRYVQSVVTSFERDVYSGKTGSGFCTKKHFILLCPRKYP